MADPRSQNGGKEHDEDADRLDAMLRNWAGDNEASASHLEGLEEAILAEVELPRPAHRWPGVAAAIAATLLAAVGGWAWFATRYGNIDGTGPEGRRHVATEADNSASVARLSDKQLRQLTAVHQQMRDVFGTDYRWFAESADQVKVGLDDEAGGAAPTDVLAVRLTLQRREQGRPDQWSAVWQMDLVSHSEQVVRLSPEEADGAELTVWAYSLPTEEVSVDVSLALPREGVHCETTAIQYDAAPQDVSCVTGRNGNYRLMQAVVALEPGVG